MRHLKLFEDYKDSWYEGISEDTFFDYFHASCPEDDYKFTPEEIGRLFVPSGGSFRFEVVNRTDNAEAGEVQIIRIYPPNNAWFTIFKIQDEWLMVRYLDQYYKCDTYLGVNKLIKDKIECDI